ncbi:MAG: NfeD family protein [Devosia sp.]|uniref:NfeD family protein n=1 Tax=Devosia sp. TaxID=1871048 RepID=UPI0026152075|nr:NfeD family protein [Devosia sp.]MDB5538810.1 NfeD family protein [Devosia sp.]
MQVLDFIVTHGGWSWVVAGLVLLALELAVPGGVLVWLGGAALVTGLAALRYPIFWPLQFVIFGVLALCSLGLWLRFRGPGIVSDRPFLNRRAHRFIGQEAVLDEPIRDGFGRLALDDTVWRVQGPDLAAGAKVRIVDADGALLKVEAA